MYCIVLYQSMSIVRGEGSTDNSQLSELEETDTRNVVDVPRLTSVIPLSMRTPRSRVEGRHHHAGTAAVMQTTAGAQPYQFRFRRVEMKSVRTHSRRDALDARTWTSANLEEQIRAAQRARRPVSHRQKRAGWNRAAPRCQWLRQM